MKKSLGILVLIISISILAQPTFATDGSVKVENKIKTFLGNVVEKVKNTEEATEKRQILYAGLKKILIVTDALENAQIPVQDKKAVAEYKNFFQEKFDELNGLNGFSKVADENLNNFADYTMQSFEQADRTITISVTTLLIIIIIILLLG